MKIIETDIPDVDSADRRIFSGDSSFISMGSIAPGSAENPSV